MMKSIMGIPVGYPAHPSTLESNKVSFRGSGDMNLPKLNWLPTLKVKIRTENSGLEKVLLMEEILHHLGCIKPCQQCDKLLLSFFGKAILGIKFQPNKTEALTEALTVL